MKQAGPMTHRREATRGAHPLRDRWQEIGRRVVAVREDLDLTQEEFAERVGCSPSLLSQVERGIYAPVYPWILEGFWREARVSYRDWYPV